ncbi:hypothetical protein [Goodfellowiella coeruleoviolacea]|uniref:hypothetical protein n=1 Tax=Goodfellowiella coeruleoviolacea TaxID=334858 RepID=UPI0020A319A8|nr:hypothetical protein [Goodfellowiella coeruleoviolacea]
MGAAVAVVVAAGCAGIGAGTPASAAPAPSDPIVVGDCASTVQGVPGQPVALSPSAVLRPVVDVLTAVPLLGPPLAEPFRQAFTALPPIPIGAVPTGTGYITGGEIATRVTAELAKLPLLGPVLGGVVSGVRQALTAGCGVTVSVVNGVAAPVQEGAKALAEAGQQPGGGQQPGSHQPGTPTPPAPHQPPAGQAPDQQRPGEQGQQDPGGAARTDTPAQALGGVPPGDFALYDPDQVGRLGANFGRVPLRDYSLLPFAEPGEFAPSPGVRYGQVPGYAPQYGVLDGAGSAGQDPHAAGNATALAEPPGDSRGIALPTLLAVLALAGVTGGLVRSWVLARA